MKFLYNLCMVMKPLTKRFNARSGLMQYRQIWGYVAIAFNQVDIDRLMRVGPDRLCAEWVIKNGGAISTTDEPTRFIKDYNSLPSETYKFKIRAVDGTRSSLMKIGLDHFRGCKHIDTVIFHKCRHLESDGLHGLVHLKNSLLELQVSGCGNLTDESLLVIGELENLKLLRMFDLDYVKNLEHVKMELSRKLPHCNITLESNE